MKTKSNYFRSLLQKTFAFFAFITILIWCFNLVPDVSAQSCSNIKITSTTDGENYIISEKENKQQNFIVYNNQDAVSLKCKEIPSIQSNEYQALTKIDFNNKYYEMLKAFPDYLLCQLNNIYLLELYQIYTSPKKYYITELYINDYLMNTKVKTNDIVMTFKYDNDGKVKTINKRARDKDYAQYRANRSLNNDFFKKYDKIEKFSENEPTYSLLSSNLTD